MAVNIYVGCTIILILAVAGLMFGLINVRNRKSKLWLAPIMPLSMSVFITAAMYLVFSSSKLYISPWAAILFIFSEIGSLMGCYVNENMEPKSGLIRAMVIVLSVVMFFAFALTFVYTLTKNVQVQ
ncbi:MAG: hypothetical protein IJM37_06510 [Lachnospiraceae bacterium]|nr:hypothetical protein [Lachnospiraceae bacterium]